LNRRIKILKASYTSTTKPFPELKSQVDRIANIENDPFQQSVLSRLLGGDEKEGFSVSDESLEQIKGA
jgi:hypothetical protein